MNLSGGFDCDCSRVAWRTMWIAIGLFIAYLSLIEGKTDGFSIDLIHRDSPQSPSYNPHLTPSERLKSSLRRSNRRVKRNPTVDISSSTSGEYLIKLSIGTPPFQIFGVADTGSDLIWTQCQPCNSCYKQNRPLFEPKKSSTYKTVLSNSKQCLVFGVTPSQRDNKTCAYSVKYLDGSHSHGILSTDRLTLRTSDRKLITLSSRIVFGCGYNNSGLFGNDSSGVIGLGPSPGSLIGQMSSFIGGKFSYCLVSDYKSSKMHFGAKAIISGRQVVSTGLQTSDGNSYSVKLKGVSVGSKRFNFGKTKSSGMDMILDSGALVTYLPKKLYSFIEANMRREIHQEPVPGPDKFLRLCYNVSDEMKVPPVTVHFVNADVRLKVANTFIRVDDTMCLAFSSHYNVALFGSVAQQDFLIGYDLRKKTVSFKPTNCARQ